MHCPTARELSQKKCRPCEGGVAPMSAEQAKEYAKVLEGWQLSPDGKAISKTYVMKGFAEAVQLINRICDVAEAEDHHPDLHLTGYRKLMIELSTHAIKGLSENDFILASKIESLPKELKSFSR